VTNNEIKAIEMQNKMIGKKNQKQIINLQRKIQNMKIQSWKDTMNHPANRYADSF